jgi:hypothetical protein
MYYTSLLITLIASKRDSVDVGSYMNSKFFGVFFLLSWGIPHWANQKSFFEFNGAIFTPLEVFLNAGLMLNLLYGGGILVVFLMYFGMSARRFEVKAGSIAQIPESEPS